MFRTRKARAALAWTLGILLVHSLIPIMFGWDGALIVGLYLAIVYPTVAVLLFIFYRLMLWVEKGDET